MNYEIKNKVETLSAENIIETLTKTLQENTFIPDVTYNLESILVSLMKNKKVKKINNDFEWVSLATQKKKSKLKFKPCLEYVKSDGTKIFASDTSRIHIVESTLEEGFYYPNSNGEIISITKEVYPNVDRIIMENKGNFISKDKLLEKNIINKQLTLIEIDGLYFNRKFVEESLSLIEGFEEVRYMISSKILHLEFFKNNKIYKAIIMDYKL